MAGTTPARIMDAMLALLRDRRLRDITVEDVADSAQVSRQTIYRHFGTREGLIRAVVVREEGRLAEGARAAASDAADLEQAVIRSVTALLDGVRRHPLIDRMLADDPETLLPYLTLGQEPVLSTAGSIVGELVRTFVPERPDVVEDLADILSRLVISYTIAPGHRTSEEVGRLAARIVQDGLLATPR